MGFMSEWVMKEGERNVFISTFGRKDVSEYLRGTNIFDRLCKSFFISGDENNKAVITKNDNSIMATDWYDINVIKATNKYNGIMMRK